MGCSTLMSDNTERKATEGDQVTRVTSIYRTKYHQGAQQEVKNKGP